MTNSPLAPVWESIKSELSFLFSAHRACKLEGKMRLYTETSQDPWRSQEAGVECWFGEGEIDTAVAFIQKLYNDGKLPNTTPLLNPLIHHANPDGTHKPVGSGVFWATAFTLGIATLTPDQMQRPQKLGVRMEHMHRGENAEAGFKMLGISDTALPPLEDGRTVPGCQALYVLTHVQSPAYAPYYLLSGLRYLCTHGMFEPPITTFPAAPEPRISAQKVMDAAQCFEAYDCQHTLYMRFGLDPKDIDHNNRFYNLCARDLNLFDRTGPMRKGSDETFAFLVPGYIPRGAVTLIAAAGGTGKSSAAHHLCVLASIDYRPDEPKPIWLGQPVNTDICKGICVYFSGEDGPAIINARGALYDPEGRAQRLQFHRTEFVDKEISFADYLMQLKKMPEVPILVIDPARKYLTGDENDADVVSQFFEAIEEFAISKNCSVLVVHHLEKGADPRSARQVLDCLRGSQVFIDRPRVVLGMYRDSLHTVVGLSKNNIPPSLGMVTDERVFVRDKKSLQLLWLPGEEGVRRQDLTEDELEQLRAEANAAKGIL